MGFQAPIDGEDEKTESLRAIVKKQLSEMIRKKPGGGGYVLYSPNKGKKKPAKAVGEFPTKVAARKAELARFPPKDEEQLKRLRRDIDKLMKDPKKRIEKDKQAMSPKAHAKRVGSPKRSVAKDKKKNETLLQSLTSVLTEALFEQEEDMSSAWDERLASLSPAAVAADKKLQSLQKSIEKSSSSSLEACGKAVQKALKGIAKVTSDGVKKDEQRRKTYLKMTADVKGVSVGPIYVFIEGGRPRLEVSSEAKNAMTRLDPKVAKALRAELVACQEDSFGKVDVASSTAKRDAYLDKLEAGVDAMLADMNALQLTLAKNLLVQKYRGKTR